MPISTAVSTAAMSDTYELNACDGLVYAGTTERYSPYFEVGPHGAVIRAFGLNYTHFIEVEAVNNKCCPHMFEKLRLPACSELYKTQPQLEIPYPGLYRLHIKCGDPATISIQKTELEGVCNASR